MSRDNEKKEGELLDHNYDGIQELDNMLPRWWLATFYLTIVFSIIYFGYYELGTGQSIDQEFTADIAALEAKTLASGKVAFPDENKLKSVLASADSKVKGHDVFRVRCASCHGDKGQGLIGPNLTDSYWLHGDGKPESIGKTIYGGVPEKGMPPWGPVLSEEEVYAVTAFVVSLKGSNPAGAKAPQGNLVKD